MPRVLEMPDFKTEQEEAEWWDSSEGRAAILQGFEDGEAEGTIRRRTIAPSFDTSTANIRLDRRDSELARRQAEQRGLPYETYLTIMLHQALEQEAARQAPGTSA